MRVRSGEGASERRPWEIGRFLRTVTFFNPVDKVVKDLVTLPTRLLFRSNVEEESALGASAVKLVAVGEGADTPSGPAVLLLGLDSGLGARLATTLLDKGARLQIIEPDAESALASLHSSGSGSVELIGNWDSLPASNIDNVRSVVAVPGLGSDHLLHLALSRLGSRSTVLYDAVERGPEAPTWGSLDDVVMGGASRSGWSWEEAGGDGAAQPCGVFSGEVTTANSGGFASVRTRNFEPPLDLQGEKGLTLRVQGDGQRYKLVLRTDSNWDGIAYTAFLDTKPGVWETHTVPFSAFAPIFRAKTVKEAPPLQLEHVYSVQLMLSKFEADGALNPAFKPGPFRLAVRSIAASGDGGATLPKLILVQGARKGEKGFELSDVKKIVLNSEIKTLVLHAGHLEDLIEAHTSLAVQSGQEAATGSMPIGFVVQAIVEALDVDFHRPWTDVSLQVVKTGPQGPPLQTNWEQLLGAE